MANKLKGEISETLGGQKVILTLKTQQLCSLESELGAPITEILRDFQKQTESENVKMSTLCAFVKAALPEGTTDADAYAAIDEWGLVRSLTAVMTALQAGLPEFSGKPTAAAKKRAGIG